MREKYESGHHFPSKYCCSTVPIATSDASVITLMGASDLGCTSNVVFAKASLISSKAEVAVVVHCRERLLVAVDFNSAFSGGKNGGAVRNKSVVKVHQA